MMNIYKPKINGVDVSFETQSESVYYKGMSLYDILLSEGISVKKEFDVSQWKFSYVSPDANVSYSDIKPSTKAYDDSNWSEVNVPHDWSIHNAFNSYSASTYEGGYLDGGDAWYRTRLNDIVALKGDDIYLLFDGIYMESTVYINGIKVKQNFWYNPFYCEISQYLNFDGKDVVAVFVRNQQPSSRWYSGSGIFRNVHLVSSEKVSVSLRSLKITMPNISSEYKAGFVNVVNDYALYNNTTADIDCECAIYIKDHSGNIISQSLNTHNVVAKNSTSFTQSIRVKNPVLWSIHSGNCYFLEIVIYVNNTIICSRTEKFGFRWFSFDANAGFCLNDVPLKIRGVCLHHDNGCLGAVENHSAVERKINILKKMGCNAIRTSHNPASSILLDVCADEGIMVMEEMFDSWETKKKTYDFSRFFTSQYADVIKQTVMRDRNNPAVIIWSVGNEIDNPTATTATSLRNEVRKYDDTRPITMGDNHYSASSNAANDIFDIVGFNYKDYSLSNIHSSHPTWKIFGSETASALSSRGVYTRDDTNYQCSSFDNDKVSWGNYAASSLKVYESANYLAGMFVWTGFDYLGEPTPFNKYPCRSSYFGIIDLAGFPKDIYYMYQSRWTTKPMVHILPHWNWAAGDSKSVWLYSNCYKVELFLNGISLGSKLQTEIGDKYQFAYTVTFEAGTLLAIGYDSNSNEVARDTVTTSGEAYQLQLDCNVTDIDASGFAYVECNILDASGNFCPLASNEIVFNVVGGTIKGVDNGDATDVTKMADNNIKKAFNGKCLCVVQLCDNSLRMMVKATSDKLVSSCIIVMKNNKKKQEF